jgi:hypothetical protein
LPNIIHRISTIKELHKSSLHGRLAFPLLASRIFQLSTLSSVMIRQSKPHPGVPTLLASKFINWILNVDAGLLSPRHFLIASAYNHICGTQMLVAICERHDLLFIWTGALLATAPHPRGNINTVLLSRLWTRAVVAQHTLIWHSNYSFWCCSTPYVCTVIYANVVCTKRQKSQDVTWNILIKVNTDRYIRKHTT